MTLEELLARQAEIEARLQAIDTEAGDAALSEERQTEWNTLNEEHRENAAQAAALQARRSRVAEIAANPTSVERGVDLGVPSPTRTVDNVFDLASIRANPYTDPVAFGAEMEGRARRIIQENVRLSDPEKVRAVALLERFASTPQGTLLAERMLVTGSPVYHRAFGKAITGQMLSEEESRALTVGTGSAGGFAVPYDLDPTIIGTWTPGVNPIRDFCQEAGTVITTVSNEWRGVTSAGVTASYAAEAAEAGDNAPTLAQPSIFPERAHAFVPFSYEVDQDWGALRQEISKMMQVARESLEATKFALGAGHASTEPQGLIAGLAAGSHVTTAGVGAFVIGDVYKVYEALPPRWRLGPQAKFLANLAIFNKVRQFDTQGGAGLWTTLGNGLPDKLLGHQVGETSPMASAVATNNLILLVGNFLGYRIVDRVGMTIELVPHLFGANRRPTGQRGIYAFWRNSAGVIIDDAFRLLKVS